MCSIPHWRNTPQYIYINVCPETFNLWVTVESVLFSINVWAAIVDDCLVSAHVLPHWLTSKHYRDFLLHDLPNLVADVPLVARA
jgi:hypothetical protein